MKSIWDVIKGPVITEKALTMKDEPESMGRTGNDRQMLTLKVHLKATKPEIKARGREDTRRESRDRARGQLSRQDEAHSDATRDRAPVGLEEGLRDAEVRREADYVRRRDLEFWIVELSDCDALVFSNPQSEIRNPK